MSDTQLRGQEIDCYLIDCSLIEGLGFGINLVIYYCHQQDMLLALFLVIAIF